MILNIVGLWTIDPLMSIAYDTPFAKEGRLQRNRGDFIMSQQRLAIFGNPISHSLSPQLHRTFAQQFNMVIDYEKILTPVDQFKKTVDDFRARGGLGANITIPFKTQAFDYADQLTDRAKSAGAVNTFIFKNNICIGDNTDGVGLINDFKNKLITMQDKKILLIGAGGAARGILSEIIRENPQKINIYNRTMGKTRQLAEQYGCESGSGSDIVINATNMNFQTDFPLNLNLQNTICYDLNYGDRHNTFFDYCQSHHAEKIIDGFGMLVEQAAEAFFQWFGRRPKVGVGEK